jgi:predicted phosphodiesterase
MKTKTILSIICLLFIGCTISEKTNIRIFPPKTGSVLVRPFVEVFGETNAVIVWQIKDTENSYLLFKKDDDEPKIIPAFNSNQIFRAVIPKLNPDTVYFYKIAGTDNQFSRFRTLSENRENYSFAVLGDNRTNPDKFKKIADTVSKHDVDFFLHTGDLMVDGRHKKQWYKQWFTPGRSMFEKAPVLVAWGNHEYPWDPKSYLNIFYPDRSQFKNKGYYSYQNGNVLFVHINTFEPFKPGSKQYLWLENKLKNCKLPFIVAALHVSAFTGAGHTKGADVKEVRQYIVPLLQKYNVNLVVSGHDHVYDRSEYSGTTYVIAGGAGAPLYDPNTYLNPFSVKAEKVLHYVICDVNKDKIDAKVYDLSGKIIDSFTLPPRKIPENLPQVFATFRPHITTKFNQRILTFTFDIFPASTLPRKSRGKHRMKFPEL